MEIEETLNGKYSTLFSEVVEEDVYGMKTLSFIPNTIIDLGANVGIFSRFAASLFPKCQILAIEPNPQNIKEFKLFTKSKKIKLFERAIGRGNIYHDPHADNGSKEVYLSKNIGYTLSDFKELTTIHGWNQRKIKTIMLPEIEKYIKGKTVLKMDIEGNETTIFQDAESVKILKMIDYIAGELHYFAMHGGKLDGVKKVTLEFFKELEKTHEITHNHPLFIAIKK